MSFEDKKGDNALSPMQQARLVFQSSLENAIEELGKERATENWYKRMIAEQVARHFGLIRSNTDEQVLNKILNELMG